jgi:phage terminase large subunit
MAPKNPLVKIDNKLNVSINPLPKQLQVLNSKKQEILYSGARGAGKSLCLCLKVIQAALIPGNTVLLVRKTLTSLKQSTLRRLLTYDGTKIRLLPPGSYDHNKQECKIDIHGGGTIFYRGIEDEFTVRSINSGLVAIDEVIELKEEEYLSLNETLRCPASTCRQIVSATNPGPRNGWLFKRFILDKDNPKKEVIMTRTTENIYLPPDFIERFDGYDEDRYRRMVLGEWINFDKIIYSQFTRECVVRRDVSEFTEFVIGVDYGFTHPTVILLIGLDKLGHIHVLEEWCKSGTLQSDIMEKIFTYKDFGCPVVCDPSAPGLIAAINDKGMICDKANNEVTEGIERVKNYIGKKCLTIDPSCEHLISEMETYSYDDSEKPIKINDDAVDVLRYGLAYFHDKGSSILLDGTSSSRVLAYCQED